MSKPKLVPGSKLNAQQIKEVKAAFTYRLTTENGYPQRNPSGARVPAISDAEWIAQHAFYIKSGGHLSSRPNHAEPVYMVDEEEE